jgi:hypothetical protein
MIIKPLKVVTVAEKCEDIRLRLHQSTLNLYKHNPLEQHQTA